MTAIAERFIAHFLGTEDKSVDRSATFHSLCELAQRARERRPEMIEALFTDYEKDDSSSSFSDGCKFSLVNPAGQLPLFLSVLAGQLDIPDAAKKATEAVHALKNAGTISSSGIVVHMDEGGWSITADVAKRDKGNISDVTISVVPMPQPDDYTEEIKNSLAAKRRQNRLSRLHPSST